MAGQNQGVNMDQFEAYFRRADLDGDGRISGAEAVSFFQGSNLPKQVLAQIWMHADRSGTGFLGRPEFYNALKLVTVAQSKRDLTPDIVKAALYGPAAAKIPAPKINLAAIPRQQVNSMAPPASSPQITQGASSAPQTFAFRGPGVPNVNVNHHYFHSQQSQLMRPAQAVPPVAPVRPAQGDTGHEFSRGGSMMGQSHALPNSAASHPPKSMPNVGAITGISNSNVSTDWFSGRTGGSVAGHTWVSSSTPTSTLQPPSLHSVPSQPTANNSNALGASGNGSATRSFFEASSTPVAVSSGIHPPTKSNSLDSLQSAFAMQPLGGQRQQTQSLPNSGQQGSAPYSSLLASSGILFNSGQQVSAPNSSSPASSGVTVGVANSSDSSQLSWPKMKQSDIQKYTKVFMEVDTDRDGRITGEQARNLFLSWRLPREVLKQVWDLSDQDNDSMLSVREFCFALYLMERYREGRSLPASLPSNIMFDETLLTMTGQPKATYGNVARGPGFGQQPQVGVQPKASVAGLQPPVSGGTPLPDSAMMPNQHTKAQVLQDSFLNQHDSGGQTSGNSLPRVGTASEQKVDKPENVILDSKEKIEFYRTKMQDLILYKSRCDNRLNEITERAKADKGEAEVLGKKYEERYKQVAEVASKLTIEEATFRDIQERKLELHQAIVNIDRGGSTDGILQVRADRIQSDLDELLKALTERAKKHGIEIKSSAVIELPIGWQPGIQEGAVPWDEDWDKFEDQGFDNELSIDGKNVSSTSQQKLPSNGDLTHDPFTNGDGKSENSLNTGGHAVESESAYTHSEDESARSPQGSPVGRTTSDSPSHDFSDVFEKSAEADAEAHRSFDESMWGAFDTPDDTDSAWGFNHTGAKEMDSEKHRDFFESSDIDVKPVRMESPSGESAFQKRSLFFEDSVPTTPASRFGNSPRYSEAGDNFDNFSRFDSFSMYEGGNSPKQERFTRFDSINSTKDFGQSHAFSSFDEADPFGSSGPFKVSSDNQTSKKSSESWGAF
uniref:Uncharacterized protein MANES_18G003700 n=1 Tax=Rhizophora mucronata TaxID=61149 RepID=A0A2P2KS90_RHIMU